MQIITIAREFGALSNFDETTLCERLSLKLINRALLEAKFKTFGFKEKLLEKLDEKHPRILDSLTKKDDLYLETLKTIIFNEIPNTSCAIVGRGSNFILNDIPGVLKIRFVAPLDVRISNVAKAFDVSEKEAALLIKRSDRERTGFCYYYFGENWDNSSNYDLVINTGFFNLEETIDILTKALSTVDNQSIENPLISDAILKQNVKFNLFIKNNIEIQYRKIQCCNGTVKIAGNVSSNAAITRIENILNSIPGVKNIENNLVAVLKDIPKRKE